MIYTNDDTDKKRRQKYFLIKVYLLPVLVSFLVCAVMYSLTNYFNLDKRDKTGGYIISVIIGIMVWFKNKSDWLPLPDGSHYYIPKNDSSFDRQLAINEPSNYDAIFTNSRFNSALTLVCGIIVVTFGFYVLTKASIIFPFFIISIGLFLLVQGYKAFIDTTPKLKLSKQGLWTTKLGFHPWAAIRKTKIVNERGYRSTQAYLEIYLLNGKFQDIDYPDDRVLTNDLKDNRRIATLLNEFNP